MIAVTGQLPRHDLLQGIVEGVPIRVFWKDRECRYLGCNTLFAHDAGVARPEDLLGKTDFELAWKDQAALYRADDVRVMESGTARLGYEEPQTAPDGRTLWLRTSKVPLRDDAGRVIGILGIYEDITERRRTEEALRDSQDRHRQARHLTGLGHWQMDLRSRRLEWSDEVYRIFEIDPALGPPPYEVFIGAVHPDDRDRVNVTYLQSLHAHTSYEIEHRLLMPDGRVKWILEHAETRYADDGTPLVSIGTVHDITERRLALDALERSEARFRDLFHNSPDPCWIISDENLFTLCNQAAAEMLGYDSADELVATHPSKLSPAAQPDGRDSFAKANEMMAIAHDRGVHRFEWEHLRKDGTAVPVEVTLARIEIAGRQHLHCAWRDISARRRTEDELRTSSRQQHQVEERLRASEERFALAMAGANDGLWDWNLETNAVYYSPRWFSMLGYEPDECPATLETWATLVHPDDRVVVLDRVKAYIEGRSQAFEAEMRMRHKDGRSVIVLSRASKVVRASDGKPVRLVGTHVDITERKAAEQALQRTSDFLGQIIGHAAEGVSVCSECPEFPYVRFELWNDRMTEITGYTMDEINRLGWYQSLYPDPDVQQRAIARMHRMRTGDNLRGEEWDITTRTGERRTLSISTSAIARPDGSAAVIGLMQDVTARKHAERELQLAKFVMDNAPFNIAYLDSDGRVRYMNKTACETLGYSEVETRTLAVFDVNARVTREDWRRHWQALKSQRRVSLDTQHRRKDGSTFPVEVIANYMEFGDVEYSVTFDQDITQRRQLEEQFRQSQKMEAIGTLVGGIAHDFNNMLAAIQGSVYLVAQDVADRPVALENLKRIESLGTNAAAMVRQLLTFARKHQVTRQVFRLNPIIKESLKLNRTAIPASVEVRGEVCEEPLVIRGDATQLLQVMMNLFNNARDAVIDEEHARIRCTLSRVTPDAALRVKHPELASDEYARITVEDNGAGIAPENLNRIFDPFFTTKDVGKGTGLGLAMVYGAVRSHGGVIAVRSAPRAGTTFSLYLPLSDARELEPPRHTSAVVRGCGETILLVDDNDEMREVVAEVLQSLGYVVLQAVNGREALRYLESGQAHVDLMLSDVVMPVMGGGALVDAARHLDAHLPIILATGYEHGDTLAQLEQVQGVKVISKPFSVDAISSLVQSMVRGRR